jgi:hypothetical protein
MRVNRTILYFGAFLLAIGAVIAAADLGAVAASSLTDALRLWPLALVAVGFGLFVRRTRIGLAGGLIAALLPGLVVGSAFAVGPRAIADCDRPGEPVAVASERGQFDGPARVSVTIACGSLDVSTAPGSGWRFDARNTEGRSPTIDGSRRSLTIGTNGSEGWPVFGGGRDTWDLVLPAGDIDDLALVVDAGEGRVDLSGTRIGRLDLTANAADVAVDASGAIATRLAAVVNAGSLSVNLPADGDLTGTLQVNAGQLRICTPPGLGLRVETTGAFAGRVSVNGQSASGSLWQSPDYASATHRADLELTVNFGAIEINPIGGCK